MTAAARVAAQAKINLRLRVLARETSGYHSLETIFLRIALSDDVTVRLADSRSLDCDGPMLPAGGLGPADRNLAYRAAVAYADATGWLTGFAIELTKNIPAGAGLGGGSANAGAVLRALDALAPHPLGDRLIELATALGADVPFLTSQSALALGWGRGERLLALNAPAPRAVCLAIPPFPVATADAYAWLAASRRDYTPTASLLDIDALRTWGDLAALAENDFEPVVGARHREIAALAHSLRAAGATIAMLSGSGSALFGIFADGGLPTSLPGAAQVLHTTTCADVAPVMVVS